MSEIEINEAEATKPATFRKRHPLWSVAGLAVAMAAILGVLYLWFDSADFRELVRKRLVAQIETATGGRVEVRSFRWSVLNLEAEASGVVIHGLEEANEVPYAQIEDLRVRVSVLGFLSPKIRLRELSVIRPQVHLIFYPDGTTNQPQPQKPQKPRKSAMDTMFSLQAGSVSVQQAIFDLDNRAANLDFQNRYQPLDLRASDVSLQMRYVAATGGAPESYRIEAGARDLDLVRNSGAGKAPLPVHAYFQATIDLTRNAAILRSMRLTGHAKGTPDRTLEITGTLLDFGHPRWNAKIAGELDLRLLDPVLGYPFAPEGIARLDLGAAGEAGEFRIDGPLHATGAAYIDPSVNARNITLDAKVHADPMQLRITDVAVRFRQGGELDGEVLLDHWLPPMPGQAQMQSSKPLPPTVAAPGLRKKLWSQLHRKAVAPIAPPTSVPPHSILVKAPVVDLPVNGKVTAKFKGVTVDTVLDIVGQAPFQRLGIDGRLDGLATATWVKGDNNTVAVTAGLNVSPSGRPLAGEVAANGSIEGTYTQRDGAVDLRKFELNLPASQIEAHGHLGAFPVTSPNDLAVDLRTRNLAEFDTVLRNLGLARSGRSGAAALPVSLAGQGEFHGTWMGSLASPKLSGTAKATQIAIEMPPNQGDKTGNPQNVRWDSIQADGSYAADRIAVVKSQLVRGAARINIEGSLVAPGAQVGRAAPGFDSDSQLNMRVQAAKITVDDLQPFTRQKLPVTGALDAQLETNGPLRALGGSGWVEVRDGTVYGEPVTRMRAEGSLANQAIKLTSITATSGAGTLTGTGSYDLRSKSFQAEARSTGIDVGQIQQMRQLGTTVSGKLNFGITGSGTLDDPRLEAHATLAGLTVGGESLGALDLKAHTVDHAVLYDVSTRLATAQLNMHGQTELRGQYQTQADLSFSQFNIDAVLKLAHVEGLSGQSALAGAVSVQGPLAHPQDMRGEANLRELAVTVSGVHLQSPGGIHASLSNGRVTLDPVHVTGEDTDMHAQGSLTLKGNRQLDFAASGSVNLKLAETLDRDLMAGGTTTFQVEAHGPLANPGLRGKIDFQNGSLALEDLPNGLSQIHGTLEFNQNRLEVKSLTAMTGGGLLSVGGYLAYQNGIYADLSVNGKGIRIRYPEGVSSLADANLRLQGTQNSLQLSGGVMLTRFSVSQDLDIAALAAQATTVQPVAAPDAPSNHIRLDVRIQSSPQLNFQNAYAKLAGDVDLRLRGTVASPSLLGRISVTEGNAMIAGTRYELQRGEITFTNPVRIQPTIDLNATARVEDYDITLGLHGTPEKMGVSYRSDPPLPESDVVALLAVGRTQSEQGLYTQQQQQSAGLSPSTDVLLGGALNATVSSRVQRLFGAGSVKVDPSYLGALGNSTTRITVEEQLGKNVTLMYATNVDTTAQQLLQAEIAINRHVSVLVARDESGVFSMVLKATRRYR
jgi:translocation and assembly module TamB